MSELHATRKRLLDALAGLSKEQWNFKPAGRWRDAESLAAHFQQSRDRLIAYVESTQDDLRSHFLAHRAVGLLDGYQWVLLAAGHTERHVLQIEEVKAHAAFPRGGNRL